MKLENIYLIEGEIELLTGLHIGAGNDRIEIGGMDNPVVRDPVTKEPYIPGSSIKGKMRMLLELYTGAVDKDGEPLSYKSLEGLNGETKEKGLELLKLFGVSGAESEKLPKELGITRLSFYDQKLTEDSRKLLKERVGALMTEEKTEVRINRISGTGEHPRYMERVPAGAKFEFKMSLKVFEGDSEEKFFNLIKKGLKLLEADSLGGSGSRGYGKIRFNNLKKKSLFKNKEDKEENFSIDDVTL
jgi:CRISPR-associated protein Csm3